MTAAVGRWVRSAAATATSRPAISPATPAVLSTAATTHTTATARSVYVDRREMRVRRSGSRIMSPTVHRAGGRWVFRHARWAQRTSRPTDQSSPRMVPLSSVSPIPEPLRVTSVDTRYEPPLRSRRHHREDSHHRHRRSPHRGSGRGAPDERRDRSAGGAPSPTPSLPWFRTTSASPTWRRAQSSSARTGNSPSPTRSWSGRPPHGEATSTST